MAQQGRGDGIDVREDAKLIQNSETIGVEGDECADRLRKAGVRLQQQVRDAKLLEHQRQAETGYSATNDDNLRLLDLIEASHDCCVAGEIDY